MEIFKKSWRPLLALLLLSILIIKGPFDPKQLKFVLTQPKILALGFAIFFMQLVLFSVRWRLFINLITALPIAKIVRLNLVGLFFNLFIPGGVGGDIVKALELSKSGDISRSQGLSTVLSDRIFGLFSMITMALIFLLVESLRHPNDYVSKLAFLSFVLFAGMTFSLLFLPQIFTKLSSYLNNRNTPFLLKFEKFISTLHFTFITFRKLKLQSKSFLLSFFSQLLAIYFMYQVVIALGVEPPSFLIFFSLSCFGFVASAIPIMPGGIGVGQYAFFVLFAHLTEDLGKATVIAITTLQLFNLFYALIGGVIFAFMPKLPSKTIEVSQ
jgi:uncharacterized protein (TIRG00374 family)